MAVPCTRSIRPAALAVVLLSACAGPDPDRRPGLALYGGRYADASLVEDILAGRRLAYEDAWLLAATWSEPMARLGDVDVDWELGLAQHAGLQHHQELNALVLLRYRLPWDASLPTSLAIGEGLSYATERPPLEVASHDNTGAERLLNHLVLELALAPERGSSWELLLRVHHRSGVFGLFDGVSGGSNVIAVGVRWFL